ncbi:MAG: hypothetical protein GY751_17450 [Bacteroidetes bacterium]|nr:hypothetical protein [Bacteroidota bacterium]
MVINLPGIRSIYIARILMILMAAFAIYTIYDHFPGEGNYYVRADEGKYWNQADHIKKHGLIQGFRSLKDQYIEAKKDPNQVSVTHPLRVSRIISHAAMLTFVQDISAGSYFSLISFAFILLLTYVFIRRYYHEQAALITCFLLCFSPLSAGLARRALFDVQYYLVLISTLFIFIALLKKPSWKRIIAFSVLMSISMMFKESTILYVPFFYGILLTLFALKKIDLSFKQFIATGLLPLIIVVLTYTVLFGGLRDVIEILQMISGKHMNIGPENSYAYYWHSGPWYQYFTDFMLLQPIVFLLFLGYCGYYIFSEEKDLITTILLGFFAWTIIAYIPVTRIVRYVLVLDVIIRFGAAAFLIRLLTSLPKRFHFRTYVLTAVLLSLLLMDYSKLNNLFFKHNIYDPIAYNMLVAENYFTDPRRSNNSTKNQKKEDANIIGSKHLIRQVIQLESLDEADMGEVQYLKLSMLYYNIKDLPKSIENSNKVLELNPNSDKAYNNKCACFNEMRNYQRAIESCRKALEINPESTLATNNLQWALDQSKQAQ